MRRDRNHLILIRQFDRSASTPYQLYMSLASIIFCPLSLSSSASFVFISLSSLLFCQLLSYSFVISLVLFLLSPSVVLFVCFLPSPLSLSSYLVLTLLPVYPLASLLSSTMVHLSRLVSMFSSSVLCPCPLPSLFPLLPSVMYHLTFPPSPWCHHAPSITTTSTTHHRFPLLRGKNLCQSTHMGSIER